MTPHPLDTCQKIDPWERAAAGRDLDEARRPARGMLLALAIMLPIWAWVIWGLL